MAEGEGYTIEEVAKHDKEEDAWFIIGNKSNGASGGAPALSPRRALSLDARRAPPSPPSRRRAQGVRRDEVPRQPPGWLGGDDGGDGQVRGRHV